jgi:hypothetical protein
VGRPRDFQGITVTQAVFFLPAVVLGARLWAINGVAMAADAMLALGCIILYRYLRRVVDFSLPRLILWPTLALTVASSAGLWVETRQFQNTWAAAAIKLAVFMGLYLALLWRAESTAIWQGLRWVWASARRAEGGRA